MQTFQLISHVSPDGVLQIQLPTHLANQDVEVVLTIQPQTIITKRPLGEYAGKMRMSDDFCEPLPDDFWLGESR